MMFWILMEDVDNFSMLSPIDYDCRALSQFLVDGKWGEALKSFWQPIKVKIIKNKYIGDIFSLDGCLHFVFSEKALNILLPLLQTSIEYLPIINVDNPNDKLYVINILEVLDCLDHEKSNIEYFLNSKRVMMLRSPIILRSDILENKHIFRLKDAPGLRIFVSDDFKRLIEENNLIGLRFYSLT